MAKVRPCEVCKQVIDEERAMAIPETRLCSACGDEIRKYGGEFRLTAQQERTSKAGSLKINYGGVVTAKVRNQEAIDRLKDDFRNRQE